ncbi:MAG: hypothetical protein A2017_06465 [Lentisphaerae bacterium GWF2_44_16]|nr:MAG: hypothetical protein A2017_06465 [Lentisphaerae bacterium GWF2_44_16]
MKASTLTIIEATLNDDNQISNDKKHAILSMLRNDKEELPPELVPEKEAARILGMKYNSLFSWRNYSKYHSGAHRVPFTFRTMKKPGSSKGGVLYDRRELVQYINSNMEARKCAI